MKRHFEDLQLGSIELFCRAAESSSFTAAAQVAGVTSAKHGAGLFQTYKFIVEQELAEGSLVQVLLPFGGSSRPFTLLYPHGCYVPHRVRAFVDFLLASRDEWGTPSR